MMIIAMIILVFYRFVILYKVIFNFKAFDVAEIWIPKDRSMPSSFEKTKI